MGDPDAPNVVGKGMTDVFYIPGRLAQGTCFSQKGLNIMKSGGVHIIKRVGLIYFEKSLIGHHPIINDTQ